MRQRSVLTAIAATSCVVVAIVLVPTIGAQAERHDPVIVAAGDLACQTLTQGQGTSQCQSGAVANLVRRIDPDRFIPLGDLQYNNGKPREFRRVWSVQFEDLKDITSPIPGNHEYGTTDAAGYFGYFGAAAAAPHGYYSYDLGAWHVIALNTAVCWDDPGCGRGSPQHDWLVADLAANAGHRCTLTVMHHPRYDWRPWQKWVTDDGKTQNSGYSIKPIVPFWRALHRAGVDVVMNGDNHLYQRWAPQDAEGNVVDGGTVQFTVGTGGRSLYPFGRPARPDNLVRTQNDAFGAVKLTLHPTSYTYEWVSAPRQPDYEDRGTVACS